MCEYMGWEGCVSTRVGVPATALVNVMVMDSETLLSCRVLSQSPRCRVRKLQELQRPS